jgi:EmrB/QacA subfamily drug resistance transporter
VTRPYQSRRDIPAPAADAGLTPARLEKLGWPLWRMALVIVFGAFMSGLDASVANIGLNTIRTDLHTSLDQVQWVTNGYLVALATSLPVCGWLGKKIGAGRLWLAALAVFTATSGLCAAAPGIDPLIALRLAQGLAAGLLIPAGQTILGQAVGPARLGQVMATAGIAVGAAPAVGPFIGGLVLHALSWRWLFLINLPIGAVGLALGWRFVPRGCRGEAPPLDWPGLAAISAGLPLLVYALTIWGATGTLAATPVIVPLALGAGALTAFCLRTLHCKGPLMDLRLYRSPVYAAASAAAATSGVLLFGTSLLFPLYFQLLHDQSVIGTGLRLLSLGGGTALTAPVSGRLTDRYGGGAVALCGGLLAVAVTVPFAVIGAHASAVLVQAMLAMLGVAIGLTTVPPGVAAYKTVRPSQLPDATTQVNIVQRAGGALGGALFTVILANGLPHGTGHAFHTTFWRLTGSAILALGSAAALQVTLTLGRHSPPGGPADPPLRDQRAQG